MKNYYETLGVDTNASEGAIGKAYKKLALKVHPDKGGSAPMMQLLNEARDILSDPQKREAFNARWEAYQATHIEEPETVFTDYLPAGNIRPYSDVYRKQHAAMVARYRDTPLPVNTMLDNPILREFCPLPISAAAYGARLDAPLNPGGAIQLLLACVSGAYHDGCLLVCGTQCKKRQRVA